MVLWPAAVHERLAAGARKHDPRVTAHACASSAEAGPAWLIRAMHALGKGTRRHRVVERAQLGQPHVAADRHAAQEGDARVAAQRRELVDHVLPRAAPASALRQLSPPQSDARRSRLCLRPGAHGVRRELSFLQVLRDRAGLCRRAEVRARLATSVKTLATEVRQAAP